MANILLVGIGGTGDQCLTVACASYCQEAGHYTEIISCSRPEVFEPLSLLFGSDYNLYCHEEGEKIGQNYQLITDPTILKDYVKKYDQVYVVCPDLLFRAGKYSFDFEQFNTHPQIIRQKRLLENKRKIEKLIYLSLNSNTENYSYQYSAELAIKLAKTIPNYYFYFPILTNWAGKELKKLVFKETPSNLIIDKNPSWATSLDYLSKSSYCVTLDNGTSWIAYHYGCPRLLLDPYFTHPQNVLWRARWRPDDFNESVPITSSISFISDLVKLNLEIPQTCLLPRNLVGQNSLCNFQQVLGFKF